MQNLLMLKPIFSLCKPSDCSGHLRIGRLDEAMNNGKLNKFSRFFTGALGNGSDVCTLKWIKPLELTSLLI